MKMKNTMSRFAGLATVLSILLLPVSPALALGELPVTPPADTTAPVISAVVATSLTPTSETVAWVTNELSVSTFQYGTTMSYGSSAALAASAATGGTATLTGLSPSTTYYYCIHATDASNNTSQSCSSFATSAAPVVAVTVTDTTPPVITDVLGISLEPHDANVTWATDEPAVSTLEYGTTMSYGLTATLSASALFAHSAELLGLAANTTYYYCIHATDLVGNVASSCGHHFTTAAAEVMLDTNPPTVSLVTAAPITTTSATIGWTSDEVAGGYVEYGTTSNYGSATVFDTNLALTHQATLTGLSAGTAYHYRVHARDEAGNAVVTPDETFTTASVPVVVAAGDTTPPSVNNIVAVSVGSSVATVEWDTNELAVSTLEYGTTSSYGSSATLSANALLAHSTALISLSPSTTYYYCIHATDLAGNAASSCGHHFTTEASSVPPDSTPPSILVVVHSSVAASSATIAWSTNEPTESVIEYGTTISYGSATTRTSSYDLVSSGSLTGLSAGTTYHYRVRSYDAAGNVASSPDYTLTTDAAVSTNAVQVVSPQIQAPAALLFSSVYADSVGESGASISWGTNLPSDSVVEYGTGLSFNHSVSSAALVTSHELALTGLNSDTVYEFRVVSTATGGVPVVSDTYEFSTLAVPIVIDPPANITSVSAASTSTSVSISFTTDEATAGWVEYGATTAYGSIATSSVSTLSHTASLSSLAAGTYHYRVKAVDVGDNITYSLDHTFSVQASSATVSVTVPETTTSVPALVTPGAGAGGSTSIATPAPNLVTAEGVDSQIVFSWRNSGKSTFAGTAIVRKTDGYPTSPADGALLYRGGSETFTDTALTNGTTYYYALYSYSGAGRYSNPIHVSTAPNAGVTQVKLERNAVEEQALSMQHFNQDLQRGDQNMEVEHLQQVLNTVALHDSKLTTGYFGPLTEVSLKKFQALYNLPQTGVADAVTRAALDGISNGWVVEGAPTDLALLTTDLKRGDEGEAVGDLQEFLAFEGSYTDAIISNHFGLLTEGGVKNFQAKYGVTPVSGFVGYKTRHTIQTVLGL